MITNVKYIAKNVNKMKKKTVIFWRKYEKENIEHIEI